MVKRWSWLATAVVVLVGLSLVSGCSSTKATEPAAGKLDAPDASGGMQAGIPPASIDGTETPKVAAPGAKFDQITEPPGRTIAMLDPDRMPPDTRLEVEFEPFGIGPWGPDSLVVKLNEVAVVGGQGETPDVSSLVGINAIVRLEPAAKEAVGTGGAYAGTLRAVPEQDAIVLVVEQARPLRQ